jgi:hypothetical protein
MHARPHTDTGTRGIAADATISKLKKRDRPGLATVSAREVDDDD